MISPKTPYQRALHALWGEAFEDQLIANPNAKEYR